MNLSQQQVAYILSLIEHKNFGKAAEACFVTQPTLSMQVKKAEESLGQLVFNRKRNPIELTLFGKKIAPILYDIQAEYARIELLSKTAQGKVLNELRIGVIPTISSYLIPELFTHKTEFNKETKWAFVELKSEEILEQLHAKKIDLGIMAGPIDQSEFYAEPLFNEEMYVYSSEWPNGCQIEMNQLKDKQPWLLSKGNCLRTQMLQFCNIKDENDAQWDYEGGNISLLIDMVNRYGGYTVIPHFYALYYALNREFIHPITLNHSSLVPARSVIAVCKHKNKENPDLRDLWSYLKKAYSNQEMKRFEVLNWR